MWYGAFMTVAEFIEQLKLLPQDADVIQEEGGRWNDFPDFTLFQPGETLWGRAFERTTVVI